MFLKKLFNRKNKVDNKYYFIEEKWIEHESNKVSYNVAYIGEKKEKALKFLNENECICKYNDKKYSAKFCLKSMDKHNGEVEIIKTISSEN